MKIGIKDMDGKDIEFGHILAVRYVWNSYIGVAKPKGLCAISPDIDKAFNSGHKFSNTATYQILGHMKEDHKDYRKDVYDWYMTSGTTCPIKIRVYDNY